MVSEVQRACEGQKECESQKTVGEEQRREYDITNGHRKEQPSENLTKWLIVDVDWNDFGPTHRVQNRDNILVDEADKAHHKSTEDTSIPNQISIDLMDEVVDEKCVWEDLVIITRIIGPKQPRRYIMPWVENNWGSHVVVKYLHKGFFVTIFEKKEERDQALNSKNWCFENFPLYIQPWAPNFDPLKLVVYDSPVWVRLFKLPIEYWGDPCLEKIGRSLGTLLEIDEDIIDNDSYVYARMGIAAVKQIPSCINLIMANGIWKQNIEIEKEIHACQKCGGKTHQTKKCRIFV
ncbi:hypothetical protein SUGI_0470320 [Cryptomeria japonica]|nr:hypothetical protein SUGI_0470320 [Cryptomeria japonica]